MTAWELTRHAAPLGMAQLDAHASLPPWAFDDGFEAPFTSITRTADELCVVCAYDALPGSVTAVGPFTAFSVDGPLDHSLIGVLAGLLAPLADAGISILAESTFDTDWILVPAGQADQAVAAWIAAGHLVDEAGGGMSVTQAAGFPAAALAAGLKSSGKTDLALVVNTRPGLRRGRRVHQQPGQGRAGAVVEQVLADGRLRAVILNSAGPMPAPVRRGSPTPTAPPSWWPTPFDRLRAHRKSARSMSRCARPG